MGHQQHSKGKKRKPSWHAGPNQGRKFLSASGKPQSATPSTIDGIDYNGDVTPLSKSGKKRRGEAL